jgi:hypothetical protein
MSLIFAAAAAAAAAVQPGVGNSPPASPAVVSAVSACRAIAEPGARLACFDRAAESLDAAISRREVVAITRNEVRQTRRSLFGFPVGKLPFFGGSDGEEEREITAKIASARALGYEKWRIRLDSGAVWDTIEDVDRNSPAAGDSVRIRRAALGSYLLSIDGQRGVRARRVN